MKRFSLILWVLVAGTAPAQQTVDQPYLAPNTGGHTSIVTRLLFTRDRKQLISVSQDNTIRIWDVDRGDTLRVLRPPIGKGKDGQLFAAAPSPDAKTPPVPRLTCGHGHLLL